MNPITRRDKASLNSICWTTPIIAVFAVTMSFSFLQIAGAAIILQQSPPTDLPDSDLVQFTISAHGTAGEVIQIFHHPTIRPYMSGKGVHNVAQVITNAVTPTKDEHSPGILFDPAWAPYDTHFLYGRDDAFHVGTPFRETNDGTTTGTLGLSSPLGVPRSGFGAFNSELESARFLLSSQAGSNVPFMQVVLHGQDRALLSVDVVANGNEFQQFKDFLVGFRPPPVITDVCRGCVFPGSVVTHTFQADQPIANWPLISFLGPEGAQAAQAPSFSPTTGQFAWRSTTADISGLGTRWTVIVSGANEFGADIGTLEFDLFFCPEPATASLVALAIVGFIGIRGRKRPYPVEATSHISHEALDLLVLRTNCDTVFG